MLDKLKAFSHNVSKQFIIWSTPLTFGLVYLIYLVTSYIRLDPDFGWHLKSGEYIAQFGIPKTDIFTYTASDFPWINHEWLNDVLFYWLFSIGGYLLLCLVFSAIWTFIIWLVGKNAQSWLVILATFATIPFTGVRAITWSALGLALSIVLLKKPLSKYVYLIVPLIFIFWVNLHGSFVLGLFLLGYHALKYKSKGLGILLAVCVLITLVNPYGPELYTEIFRTMFDHNLRFRIAEWQMLSIPVSMIAYIGIWLSFILLSKDKLWHKLLGLDAIFLLAGMMSMRNLLLFVVVSLPTTTVRIRETMVNIPKTLDKKRRIVAKLVIAFVAMIFVGSVIYDFNGQSMNREDFYPSRSADYIKSHPCTGNLFNSYAYGGYLIWKLEGQKLYIDGRMPSWKLNGRDYYADYTKITENKEFRDQQFSQYNITCALISNVYEKKLIKDLQDEGWKVVEIDNSAVLLYR